MALYDIYGMGNALVDMEVEVTDTFLNENGIEKGVMTLVEQDRQTQLLKVIQDLKHRRACGGSAANTMIAAAQLGGRVFYSCKVASDESGDFYYQDLLSNQVQTNLTEKRAEGTTGKCLVMITPDAQRTMNTHLGITETFSTEELRLDSLQKSQMLYVEGYLVTSPTGRAAAVEALTYARAHGVKTAMTFSDPAMAKYFREPLKEMMGGGKLDLLFCNTEEAMTFTEKETFEEACIALRKYAHAFAITRSEEGALIFDGEREIEVRTHKVKAIDTNGAGDLFAGAFLWALSQDLGFAEAGRLACACSTQLVTQYGPRLKKEQIHQIREKVFE